MCFDSPAPVNLMLEVDFFAKAWIGEKLVIGNGFPTAYNLVFGWILIEPIQRAEIPETASYMLASVDNSIESLMEKFWKFEELKETLFQFTDDGKWEAKFRTEVIVDEIGRYIVSLPFCLSELPSFKDMHQIATRRFADLKRKLEQNKTLGSAYDRFMAEYESLGHMTVSKVSDRYVIPHYAIGRTTVNQVKWGLYSMLQHVVRPISYLIPVYM